MITQRIASLVRFICQLDIAVFADITVHMEILLHGDHSHRLLCSLHRRDALSTAGTLGGEDAVEVVDAVDLVVEVDREGDAVKTVIADAATEAAGMVGLTYGLENTLHDQVTTDLTLLRGLLEARVEIVLLTVNLPVYIIERLASQSPATTAAHKTRGVVQVTHGLQETCCSVIFRVTILIYPYLTSLSSPGDLLIAGMTRPKEL